MDFIWLSGRIMSGWASCADFLFFSFLFYLEILFKSLFAFCLLIEALAAYKCIFRLLSMICLLSITFSSFNTYGVSMHLLFMELQIMYGVQQSIY